MGRGLSGQDERAATTLGLAVAMNGMRIPITLATTWQFQWLANQWRVDGLEGLQASLAGAWSGGSRLPRGWPCPAPRYRCPRGMGAA